MFTANQVFSGVYHIRDAMGVCFTLIEGAEKAILFDTGYGTEDVNAYIRTLTEKPVEVFLSHGHHDHMLGARWFGKTLMCEEDLEEFRERSGAGQRTKVMRQAGEAGVAVPEDFMTAGIPVPEGIRFPDQAGRFPVHRADLGGFVAEIIHVPGHTPGSIVIWVPEYALLLTGDDWNPCTWMWFPTSMAADRWRENMLELIRTVEETSGQEIAHVLCSHQPMMREGRELKEFLAYMTDARMAEAPAVDMGAPIRTHEIRKEQEGWQLIFDYDKIGNKKK